MKQIALFFALLLSFEMASSQIKFDVTAGVGYTHWTWKDGGGLTDEIGNPIEGDIKGGGLNFQVSVSVIKPIGDKLELGLQFAHQSILFRELRYPFDFANGSNKSAVADKTPTHYKYGILIGYNILNDAIKLTPQIVIGGMFGNKAYFSDGEGYGHGYHSSLGVRLGFPVGNLEFHLVPAYTFQFFKLYDLSQIQHNINLGLGVRI